MIDGIRTRVLHLDPLYETEPSMTQRIRQANLERKFSKEELDKKCKYRKVRWALKGQKAKRLKAKACGKKIPKVNWEKIDLPMLLARMSVKDVATNLSLNVKTVERHIKQLEGKGAS